MSMKEEKVKELRKIAFLDRDGVINKRAKKHDYIKSTAEFIFNEKIFDVLQILQNQDYEFIILTNQRGIGRNLMSISDLEDIHKKMLEGLKIKGIQILDIFFCPHTENTCNCRKPKPGLLNLAAKKYLFNSSDSILISDSLDDIRMGEKFGIMNLFYVRSNHPEDFFINYNCN